jgi:ureidoacrylate peracid hydrolase
VVTLDARPDPFQLAPGETALLVIDLQNDFGAPGGMFDRKGLDLSGIVSAAEQTRSLLPAVREAGIPIAWILMGHASDLSDAGPVGSPHRVKHPDFGDGETLIRDRWGTALLDGLAPEDGDHIVHKHRYSAFFETDLDNLLRSLGVRTLLVTGCTTSICVESTVRDAMFRDYNCVVLDDCTAEPLGTHESSLKVIETLFGWVSTSGAVREALALTPAGHGR